LNWQVAYEAVNVIIITFLSNGLTSSLIKQAIQLKLTVIICLGDMIIIALVEIFHDHYK